ncbi:alpha-amino-beta-ketobutyrate coenzyme A ligase [Pelomyxa schiedti]|nr:alpha-amino-beta-ketobutyrate coenzyme A ligase [Pelomyxa schiedti]
MATSTPVTATSTTPSTPGGARNDTCGRALQQLVTDIKNAGTYKAERIINTAQRANLGVTTSTEEVLCMCANNYLGLSDNPTLIAEAKRIMDERGFGMSSVRFICGTQDIHKQLENKISEFHRTEDTILYASCFDANAGLFEAFLTDQDAIISDELNHASIIDGVRLCKAVRYRYLHRDLADLEAKLKEAQAQRIRCVCTDGVFSMDGTIAPLAAICDLCAKYDAILMVDESHAAGFLGRTGRGACEHCGVMDRVDIINSTLGKALGGASGGYTTGRRDIIEILRQRSRPYLFSNSVPPPLVGAYLKVFDILSSSTELRDTLERNTLHFRKRMKAAGFNLRGDDVAPIAPVMLGDARLATEFANDMLQKGIYVIGFSFPVVPRGLARIRVQLSAAHTIAQIDKAVDAFIEIGKAKGVLPP